MVYKKINLLELADVERAKGKEYPKGVTIVQISATRGQVLYVEQPRIITGEYAVLLPKSGIDSKYFYYAVVNEAPHFFKRYQTGLNMRMDNFKNMVLDFENDIAIQKEQVKNIEIIEQAILLSEQEINEIKEFKNTMLSKLFVK